MNHEPNLTETEDYYALLGVSAEAELVEIKEAYHALCRMYGEDSIAMYSLLSKQDSEQLLSRFNKAIDILGNPDKRRLYDKEIKKQSGAPTGAAVSKRGKHSMPSLTAVRKSSTTESELKKQNKVPLTAKSSKTSVQGFAGISTKQLKDQKVTTYLKNVETIGGSELRSIREMRNISIDQMAEITKIRSTYLEYIEGEKFTLLPDPIYVRGFISIIAQVLDIPQDLTKSNYMSRMSVKNVDNNSQQTARA